jgi:hypothetical protein
MSTSLDWPGVRNIAEDTRSGAPVGLSAIRTGGQRPDNQLGGDFFDTCSFGFEMKFYAEFASSLDQLIDEIWAKRGKWTRAPKQDGYLRSGKRRYMRKLKGSSDKHFPRVTSP